MPTHWPYDDPISSEPPTPTWECPTGDCVCHPSSVDEDVEYRVMLCDAAGRRMPHARCRARLGGRIVADGNANEHGWFLMRFRTMPERVLLEWAPSTTPASPRYPYRCDYWLNLVTGDPKECARRRLVNLGFSVGNTLEERIRSFQQFHRYTRVTGRVADVLHVAEGYHEHSLLPVFEAPTTEPLQATSGTDGPDNAPSVPTVPPSSPPAEPPTDGLPQQGGGTPPGRGTAAGTKFPTLTIKLRARFAQDAALTSRWSDNNHLDQMTTASVFLDVDTPAGSVSTRASTPKPAKDVDGAIHVIDLTSFHSLGLTSSVSAKIAVAPASKNELSRAAGTRAVPVGPKDKNTTLSVGHLLLRELEIDVELDSDGKLLSALAPAMEESIGQSTIVTNCRLRVMPTGNVLLVDWRPDFVQSIALTKKKQEIINVQLQAGTETTVLAEDELIVLHQTATPTSVPAIGSTLNLFLNTSKSAAAHYVVDVDGFVVKLANEDIAAVHAGGVLGDAWRDLVSRTKSSQTKAHQPLKTIGAFSNITVGIEHVHGVLTNPFSQMPNDVPNPHPTSFPSEQMDGSVNLIRQFRSALFQGRGTDSIVTHNQIAIASDNRVGRFKPHCPGSGYDWQKLEDKQFARKTRFTFVFKTKEEKAIDSFLGSSSTKVIDAAANGSGHIARLQRALRAIGYMMPVVSDNYADLRDPLRAFMIRHFSGPSRSAKLKDVMDANTGEPKANRLMVETILASEEDL